MTNKKSNTEFRKLLRWYVDVLLTVGAISLIIYGLLSFLPADRTSFYRDTLAAAFLDYKFYIFVAVGFIAQLIDSSLGMAYGVSSSTFLIATGVSPKLVSATINVSQLVNNAISALSHFRMGNIDKKLFLILLIPGSIGAFIGASLLTTFDGQKLKPFIAIYLLIMGLHIIRKAFNKNESNKKLKDNSKIAKIVAFMGGFISAFTGGGWGPIVTTTLISTGQNPRKVIGSVNSAKYFIILIASTILIIKIDNLIDMFINIIGLIIGGVIAAPLGAFITKHIPMRPAIFLVGVLIISLSTYTLFNIYF